MFNFQNMSLKEEYILFSSFLLAGISCWLRCNVEKLSSHAYTMNWTIVVLWSLLWDNRGLDRVEREPIFSVCEPRAGSNTPVSH